MDRATQALLEMAGIFIGIPLLLIGVGVTIGYWLWGG